ncbi:hypothetical protein PMAYCL1PPCAC_05385, partial [Pristionchus mayeri]
DVFLKKNTSSHLGVYLQHLTYETRPWSIDVSAQFRLLGRKGDREFELKTTFHNGCTRVGIDKFIPWKELVSRRKGFINIKDEQIVIEARFTLSNIVGISPRIDFTDADEPRHDITLIFNGGKLHANKQMLAVHSPVFNAMFYGNFTEKKEKEIELKGIDREKSRVHFFYSNYIIYYFSEDMRLLESLLVIADRFDFKAFIERVEESIADNWDMFSLTKILLFIDKHDSFRFIKWPVRFYACYYLIDNNILFQDTEEYHQLSESAKSACDRICHMLSNNEAVNFAFWQ